VAQAIFDYPWTVDNIYIGDIIMITVSKTKPDVYQIITDQILKALDEGTVPWRKPWRGGSAGRPKSLATRKPYNGINVWLLSMSAQAAGFESCYWVTYKKAQDLGGQVRKGEKSSIAVFWKKLEKEKVSDSGSIEKYEFFVLRYYRVFNIDQCDNLNPDKLPVDAVPDIDEQELVFEPLNTCEQIVKNMPKRPEITHSNERRAYYRPSTDEVHMPNKQHFESEPLYYNVLFHELSHSTGHSIRLSRKESDLAAFGSQTYGKEELIAEFSACMLCGIAGIESATIENSASYIDNWSKAIKKDRKLVVQAASAGQKAADYIRNI
jgi:antirestriction protein ArdC